MTGISTLIVAIDMKLVKKMFEEYFLLGNYIDNETYTHCYKP